MGALQPEGTAGEEQARGCDGSTSLWRRNQRRAAKPQSSTSPPASAWAKRSSSCHGVSKGFGDKLLIEDLSAHIPRGAIVGIIGGNGAGKSTLLQDAHGSRAADSGNIDMGETVDIAYVDQSRDT